MKKRYFILCIFLMFLMVLTSCKKSSINQKEIYQKIQSLCDGYSSEGVRFSAVLSCEEKNITLTNSGFLYKDKEQYTYEYSYQYLNEIGSGATSLISTETGSIHGAKAEVLESGFEVTSEVSVTSLDIANSFKTYTITESDDSYRMKGYIARNTIINHTENLDNDIRFNYELIVNKDITKIEKLIISYVTVRFDSVIITITF